jgi:hypothetical protein
VSAPLDGNVLAGAFREVFAVDITAAVAQCGSCGHTGVVAEIHVYADAPGLVGRCPGCAQVLLRLVRSPDRAWLDLRGLAFVEFPMPEP